MSIEAVVWVCGSQLSLEILPAPATILVLHMLPIALTAGIASLLGAWESTPFSIQVLVIAVHEVSKVLGIVGLPSRDAWRIPFATVFRI